MNKEEKLEALEEIKEDSKVLEFIAITMQEKENLQSNWNSLRECIIKRLDRYDRLVSKEEGIEIEILRWVRDKMNELEGKDNNENN